MDLFVTKKENEVFISFSRCELKDLSFILACAKTRLIQKLSEVDLCSCFYDSFLSSYRSASKLEDSLDKFLDEKK